MQNLKLEVRMDSNYKLQFIDENKDVQSNKG